MPFQFRVLNPSSDGVYTLYVPGWAMDGRIFNIMAGKMPSIIIDTYDPFSLKQDISKLIICEKISKLHYIGFSMGAMAGTGLDHPEITNWTWISPALCYPKPVISFIEKQLILDPIAYLKSFYASCFNSKNDFTLFWNQHGQNMATEIPFDTLIQGLNFLSNPINFSCYAKPLLYNFIFGKQDKIIPKNDFTSLLHTYSEFSQILEDKGHFVLPLEP